MRRAVCLISLVTLIAQQMICCCDGAGVHHTENASGNTSVQAGVADSLEVAASKKSCCGHVTRTLDLLTGCLFIDVGDLALLLDDQCEPSFSSRIPVWVTHPPRSVLSVYLV